MSSMYNHIDDLEEEIDNEFHYAQKFIHKWTSNRHQKIQSIVDSKVENLYQEFINEHKVLQPDEIKEMRTQT